MRLRSHPDRRCAKILDLFADARRSCQSTFLSIEAGKPNKKAFFRI